MPVTPKVSIFLLSHNKGAYALDAIGCVFRQTFTDWELWVLENSNDGHTNVLVENDLFWRDRQEGVHYVRLEGAEIERKRKETYIPAYLLNVYYPEANGEFIFYMSDDDLIDAECLSVLVKEFEDNPDYHAVYCGLRIAASKGPGKINGFPDTGIPAKDPKSFPGSCDKHVDGGQVMHRKTCLDSLVFPYFEEEPHADIAQHCDGIFLERLVGRFTLWPVDRYLVTHRWTPKSLWGRSDKDAPT